MVWPTASRPGHARAALRSHQQAFGDVVPLVCRRDPCNASSRPAIEQIIAQRAGILLGGRDRVTTQRRMGNAEIGAERVHLLCLVRRFGPETVIDRRRFDSARSRLRGQ